MVKFSWETDKFKIFSGKQTNWMIFSSPNFFYQYWTNRRKVMVIFVTWGNRGSVIYIILTFKCQKCFKRPNFERTHNFCFLGYWDTWGMEKHLLGSNFPIFSKKRHFVCFPPIFDNLTEKKQFFDKIGQIFVGNRQTQKIPLYFFLADRGA